MSERASQLPALAVEAERRLGLSFEGVRREAMLAGLTKFDDPAVRQGLRDTAGSDATTGLLADLLTVGESSFFRDRAQMRLLAEDVLPEVLRRRRGPLRVWSAGCAGGEEAYTLAMLLIDAGVRGDWQVVGTDVSPTALRRAHGAVYSRWSLRNVTVHERRRWFVPEGECFRVADSVAARVRFERLNLLEAADWTAGSFDVVLCRNVLVYLTPTAIATVAATLRDRLIPGGWLLTAATDPPLGQGGLELPSVHGSHAYRRVDVRRPGPPARSTTDAGYGAREMRRAARRAYSGHPPGAPQGGQMAPAPAPSPGIAVSPAVDARASGMDVRTRLQALRTRVSEREVSTALASAIEADPLAAELRHLEAVLNLERGRVAEAVAAAAAATYLQPDLAMAHLVLGIARRMQGEETAASRSFSTAARLFGSLPADEPAPHADGELAGRLARMAEALGRTQ